MLPGKKYKPEDFLRIAWRRKWFIVIPFVTVAVVTAGVSRLLPNRFRSDTLIMVIPQRVPESYVKSTVTITLEDRLQSIRQQIMSRTRLERMVQEFDLYQESRRTSIMEDIVERMRRDIEVQVVRGDAFRVSYVSHDPRTAARVADRLANAFIDESMSDRTSAAETATTFLDTQLQDVARRLDESERKLAEYKLRNAGQLPTERDSNLQGINNTQNQVRAVQEGINRDRERRYLLEKQIADLTTEVPNPANVTVSGDDPTSISGATPAAQLEAARAQLRVMELRLKPEHPDILRMERVIRDLEAKVQAEALQQPLSPGQAPSTPAGVQRAERLKGLQMELEMINRQIALRQRDEKQLAAQIASYQSRVEGSTVREPELASLTRDYETIRKTYEALLAKQEESKIAANLERRQIGEQFRTLDQARVPERPISPNRPMINMIGALLGLGLGLGLVALMEYRDTSFRTDDEVVSLLALPVLAVVPVMLSRKERAARRRRNLALGLGAIVLCLAAAVGAGWFFFLRG